MKILLFGKNGQVGWELQRSLAPLGDLVAVDCDSDDYCGDFTNLDGITQTICAVVPDVIVNAAAYTAVDKAETDIELARALNALAPAVLATEARRSDAWLIHYSTDYVFDGSGEQPYKETDATNPLSVYGKTKLEGDECIRKSECKHLIFRTSWVYAANGRNFAKTMLRLAQERDELNVVCDQFGAPTSAELLADITAHCILQALHRPEVSGLYHVAASGVTSWYDYACFVIDSARKAGLKIIVAPDAIKPILAVAYPLPAPRPGNSRLDTHLFQATFGLKLPNWQSGVARMLSEICEKKC
jgi:dTDP-4-dehydrorhamnose reductase